MVLNKVHVNGCIELMFLEIGSNCWFLWTRNETSGPYTAVNFFTMLSTQLLNVTAQRTLLLCLEIPVGRFISGWMIWLYLTGSVFESLPGVIVLRAHWTLCFLVFKDQACIGLQIIFPASSSSFSYSSPYRFVIKSYLLPLVYVHSIYIVFPFLPIRSNICNWYSVIK